MEAESSVGRINSFIFYGFAFFYFDCRRWVAISLFSILTFLVGGLIKLSPVSYLCLIGFLLAAELISLFFWGMYSRDHFAAIPLNEDAIYYRNYGEWLAREIQDRDIFYHNIGESIKYARRADIILVGHSMLMWALREDQIKAFERKHGVKIYNLGFAGVASGEFVRRIAKRWGLKPKLWVINADDQAANFFDEQLSDFGPFGKSRAIEVVRYGRLRAYLQVAGRNLRWRLEDFILNHAPDKISEALSLSPSPRRIVWRSIETGNWYLEELPSYTSTQNPPLKLLRSQDCHAKPPELELARRYLSELGGSSVLMLIPYAYFCPQRVRELAQALQVETVLPPRVEAYTTADGGQHLDKRGATAFTAYFLSALERTEAFRKITSSSQTQV